MIKSITVTNYLGDSIKLDLARPENTGFAIKSISGLGPGKAIINTNESATNDGGFYNSSRLPNRNIVITLKYLWTSTQSIEEGRHLSYKYFPIKKKVTLLVETDTRKAEIEGYVEANEPNIFSKDECADISIICPNPFFRSSENSNVMMFSTIEPLFEFPFSNESLTEDLIVMGGIKNLAEAVVMYDGDADIGATITIHAIGAARNVAVYNTGTREIMRIDTDKLTTLTGSGIITGDDIVICTVKGQKSVNLIRRGVTTNILNCLARESDWFQLRKGENIFAYTAEEGLNNLELTIEHRTLYEGV